MQCPCSWQGVLQWLGCPFTAHFIPDNTVSNNILRSPTVNQGGHKPGTGKPGILKGIL